MAQLALRAWGAEQLQLGALIVFKLAGNCISCLSKCDVLSVFHSMSSSASQIDEISGRVVPH